MSRTLSDTATDAVLAESTSEVFLELLTIEEATLSTPIRVVNDTVDVTSNGDTYTACAFRVVRPTDDGQSLPSLQLEIDNVSLELIPIIVGLTPPITASVELVLASDPDTIEVPAVTINVREIKANSQTISASVVEDDWLSSRWPKDEYDMSHYRGLYE